MSMPMKAIDRLFTRLAATYGASWTRQWADVPMGDVKTAWAHELSPFADRLDAVAWALENLPPKCPNAIEFKQLCRSAPRPAEQQLPEPPADPARVAAELAKLADVKRASKSASHAHSWKGWAQKQIELDAAGVFVRPITLRFAREALRLHLQTGASE